MSIVKYGFDIGHPLRSFDISVMLIEPFLVYVFIKHKIPRFIDTSGIVPNDNRRPQHGRKNNRLLVFEAHCRVKVDGPAVSSLSGAD